MGGSMLFVALCALAGYGPAVLALPVVSSVLVASDGQGVPWGPMLGFAALFAFLLALVVFVQLVATFVLARNDRVLLYLFSAGPTDSDVTLRAEALACAPLACGLVPLVGLGVGLVWWAALRVLTVWRLHRLSRTQAALVVVLPIALVASLMAFVAVVVVLVGAPHR